MQLKRILIYCKTVKDNLRLRVPHLYCCQVNSESVVRWIKLETRHKELAAHTTIPTT